MMRQCMLLALMALMALLVSCGGSTGDEAVTAGDGSAGSRPAQAHPPKAGAGEGGDDLPQAKPPSEDGDW